MARRRRGGFRLVDSRLSPRVGCASPQVGAVNPDGPSGRLPQVKSLSRGTLILRTLADRPMRPIDLSRELDVPWATLYRSIRGLTEEGMLQRDESTGEYSIGPLMWGLATSYLRDHPVLRVGLGHLEKLLPSVEGLLKLTERCGGDAVTLFAEQNPQVPSVRRIREQYRIPCHAVSFGQVLLAFESPDVVEEYLKGPLAQVSGRTVTDADDLRGLLAEIRRDGFAVSRAELQSDNGSIAVPVFDKDGHVVASLSAVLPLQHLDEPTTGVGQRELLTATAVAISEALGWRPFAGARFASG